MSRTVAVVPHTHWDREWYAPFEAYQTALISMMDGLLALMEGDGGPDCFHLDGQVAMVDDYLAGRPAAEERIRRLVSAGRLAVGPWYVLMDEFCVSAETIVRNLQLGLTRAASLGAGDGPVGYLPDMFGHVAQMPQILRQAGMDQAVVWRGVPAAVKSRAFDWVSPDGSRVRAEYLPVGYAGGAFIPKDAESLVRRMAAHEEEVGGFLGPDEPLLLLNGGDHQGPQPWLPGVLAEANRLQDRFRFRQTGLAAFLRALPRSDRPAWEGELRSGARAPILMGVLSNRVDVKQAAAAAEAILERRAEPLGVLWLPPDLWPAEILDRAWLEVIRNSAHDSVCACSADAVVRAVRHRYDSAQALGAEVVTAARSIAEVATATEGVMLLNPSPHARGGVVELELPGNQAPAGTQQLAATAGGVEERHGYGRDLSRLLGELARDGWLGPDGRGVDAAVSDAGGALLLTLRSDRARTADPAMAPVMAEAWARAGAGPDRALTVRVERSATQRVLARVEDVPGWGWAMWRPSDQPSDPSASSQEVRVADDPAGPVVGNGLVEVVVDRATGTFSLDGVAGQNQIVEEGDEGDTYNFSPASRPPVTAPDRVEVRILERGPVRAVVRVVRVYGWEPAGPVVSDVEVVRGDAAVRVTTTLEHTGKDHRIRAWFPLGGPAAATTAECAFATVERATAEGGPQEPALATFPSRRFVTAGPLTATHVGLLEHELVEMPGGGPALAVTLLRATGILSRPAPPARPNVAGPPLPVPDAQMPGPQEFRYAIARDCADPYELADRTWNPLEVVRSGGHGHLPDRGRRLAVNLVGAQLSSLRRREGAIEMRVFNPDRARTGRVGIPGHSGTLVDLAGRVVGRWEAGFDVPAGAVVTARLDASSLD